VPMDPPDQPLISIVINNHNYGQYIGRAIESALGQSYERVEVIVVDDGSSDGSRDVIARYSDRCIAVFQKQRGQGGAYNSGFGTSRGDIVLFLDSDDVLYPDAATEIAGAWAPSVAKVQFPLDAIDALERKLGHRVPNLPFVGSDETLPLVLSYGYYPSPPGSGNAFSRQVLERILPANEAVWRIGVDGLVIGLAPLYGDIVSLPISLGAYRHHDRNHSEASGTNLRKIRNDLLNEANRATAIKSHAAASGHRIEHDLSLRIPGHCKGRLVSLRLERETHPFSGDSSIRLALSGINACWRFPHHRLSKRVAVSVAFALLPLVPRAWLERNLDQMIIGRRRHGWLRRLMPAGVDPGIALASLTARAPARRPPVRAVARPQRETASREMRVRSRGNS
jgi:glycosyltransferase involved in cell wall biosynthesis